MVLNKKIIPVLAFLVLGLGFVFYVSKTQVIPVTVSLPSSTSLDLSNKNLEKLPSYVLGNTSLENLNLANNKLTGALPSEIGKLTKLKNLNVSNNLMTGVPAEIGSLSSLEVLDLSNNKLTGLPNELANLKKLKILNISGNNYSTQDLDVILKGLPLDVRVIR